MTLEISAKDIRDQKRSNRFTGESIMLNAEEAKKHDEIFVLLRLWLQLMISYRATVQVDTGTLYVRT